MSLVTKSDIYLDCFSSEFTNVYGDIKEFTPLKKDWCYQRALSAFVREGRQGERQRRDLLYYTLQAYGFRAEQQEDTIVKMFPVLPSSNLETKRVLDNVCNLYNNPPKREIAGKNDTLLADVLRECKFDAIMNYIHRVSKLTGEIAIRPRIRKGKVNLQCLLPDNYQTVKDSFGNVKEIYIPFIEHITKPNGQVEAEQRFEYWDAKYYRQLDKKGNPTTFTYEYQKYNSAINGWDSVSIQVNQVEHGYSRIPFEVFTADINDNDGSESISDGWELVTRQLELNAINLLGRENFIYNGFSLWYFINYGLSAQETRISPGQVFIVDDPNPDASAPEAGTVSPNTQYLDFEELYSLKSKAMFKNWGLPASLIQENPGLAASGEAMKQDWRELEEKRKMDMVILKAWDSDLVNLVALVATKDPASRYLGKFTLPYEINLDYTESVGYETFEDKSIRLTQQKTDGTISLLHWYQAYTGDDAVTTDEEVIEIINSNLEMFNKLGAQDAGQNGTIEGGVGEPIASPDTTDTNDGFIPEEDI